MTTRNITVTGMKKLSTGSTFGVIQINGRPQCGITTQGDATAEQLIAIYQRKRSAQAARERYRAMRDLGLVRTPYGWE